MTMNLTPRVSIVIPAYNCAGHLAATLNSVVAQTINDWECVVVDDGSQDDTSEVAASFARRDRRIRAVRQANGGPSKARNHGFRLTAASSKYVTFMDGDDVWLPNALEVLNQEADRFPDSIGAHALAEFIDAEGNLYLPGEFAAAGRQRLAPKGGRMMPLDPGEPTQFASLVMGSRTFPPGLLLAKRAAYEAAGPFDETLRGPEDWDMLLRLSRHGDIRFIDKVILLYRRHDKNYGAKNQVPGMAFRVLCKNFHSPENTPAQQRIARAAYRATQITAASERLTSARRFLADGRIGGSMRDLAGAGVSIGRYLRGHPPYPT